MDAGAPIALVLIGSFAVDRVVSGALFLLSLPKSWRQTFPDPDLIKDDLKKATAIKKRKLWYFVLAALLSLPIVYWGNIRIFEALGIPQKPELGQVQAFLDILLTTLLFVGGADRIADLLKKHGGPASVEPAPGGIEVFGTLKVEDERSTKDVGKCAKCSAELEAGSGFCGHCGARVEAPAGAG
jgi:hypothetical protein